MGGDTVTLNSDPITLNITNQGQTSERGAMPFHEAIHTANRATRSYATDQRSLLIASGRLDEAVTGQLTPRTSVPLVRVTGYG